MGGESRARENLDPIPEPESPVEAAATAVSARLNGLVHGRMRLGILSLLAVSPELSFTELKQLLDASDGNLSLHARKLEEAGYIECRKRFVKRIPRTIYQITRQGRKALERYLAHMEAIIQATRGSE